MRSARVAVERWPCCAWRLLEQFQRQCALRQPEQEPSRQPQPKLWFPRGFGFFSSTPREALAASHSQSRPVQGPDGRAVVRVQTAVRCRSADGCGLAESQNRPARAGRREPNVLAGTFLRRKRLAGTLGQEDVRRGFLFSCPHFSASAALCAGLAIIRPSGVSGHPAARKPLWGPSYRIQFGPIASPAIWNDLGWRFKRG